MNVKRQFSDSTNQPKRAFAHKLPTVAYSDVTLSGLSAYVGCMDLRQPQSWHGAKNLPPRTILITRVGQLSCSRTRLELRSSALPDLDSQSCGLSSHGRAGLFPRDFRELFSSNATPTPSKRSVLTPKPETQLKN